MPEELYNSHDYCSLAEELEAVKAELAEVTADKYYLINAAMDGGDTFHYTAHDMGYRDMERKVKYLEADYVISNRELLIKQVENQRLTAELAKWKQDAERLAKHHLSITKENLFHCSYCGYITTDDDGIMVHQDNCPITLHRELVAKYKVTK